MELLPRTEAIANGLNHYFTGKPCVNGQVFVRRVNGHLCMCKPCQEIRLISGMSARARSIHPVPAWQDELDNLVMIEAHDLRKRRQRITGNPWQVDHMVPLQSRTASGLHVAANMQVIPAFMNKGKCNRMTYTQPGEWIGAL